MSELNSEVDVSIAGTGSYVPERVLTNDELASMVDTSNEWILTRTGRTTWPPFGFGWPTSTVTPIGPRA